MFNPGNWIMVPRSFLRLIDFQYGILLAYLGDASDKYLSSTYTHNPDNLPKADGWFICPLKRVAEELGMSEPSIKRWFQHLVKVGAVEVRRKGFDNVRWLRMRWDVIDELFAQREQIAQSKR